MNATIIKIVTKAVEAALPAIIDSVQNKLLDGTKPKPKTPAAKKTATTKPTVKQAVVKRSAATKVARKK